MQTTMVIIHQNIYSFLTFILNQWAQSECSWCKLISAKYRGTIISLDLLATHNTRFTDSNSILSAHIQLDFNHGLQPFRAKVPLSPSFPSLYWLTVLLCLRCTTSLYLLEFSLTFLQMCAALAFFHEASDVLILKSLQISWDFCFAICHVSHSH